MPRQTFQIGPFAGIYVGLTGQASALTQVNAVRTNGGEVFDILPSEYVPAINAPVQTGNHTAGVTLEFMSTDDQTTCLAKGLPLGSDINGTPGMSQYAVLLVGYGSDNYYLPRARTEKLVRRNYNKRSTTNTSIAFTGENRDASVKLIYKGTLAELQTIMSTAGPGQWPL
jgi:hypothetical protein